MRDPHVVALRYRLVPTETISFDQPPTVERDTEAFQIRLADNIVTFEMLEHHASEESARERVEPYLRAWEILDALDKGRPEMSFEFEWADVIDRDPLPPGVGQVIHAKAAMAAAGALDATLHFTRSQYPEPPDRFVLSDDVKVMWGRYNAYLNGEERLDAMAYACLSKLEERAGRREQAAKQYNISSKVLNELGRLTTEVGDEQTARKYRGRKERRSYTRAEQTWIKAALRAVIRRAGQWAYDSEAQWPKLTMNDLPKLPSF